MTSSGAPAGGGTEKGVTLGAAFLMATSAIGPGFLTQTAVFTALFGADFAFAVLVSVLVDVAAQANVWRVLGVSRRRGQELATALLPGLGSVVAALVAVGGLAFNVGNIAGCGLGLAVLGLPTACGARARPVRQGARRPDDRADGRGDGLDKAGLRGGGQGHVAAFARRVPAH